MGEFNLKLVRTWFIQCTKHHEKCKTFSSQWFPTRLIYLGSQNCEVRLIISDNNPPNGPYMSLSHRWGSQDYMKLKSSTIMQLQNAIAVDTLPRVFQDSIKVARLLGFNYLWIDALCIKQDPDDLSDWEIESLNMGKVYSHALLNLSATLSHDGSESLFQQQPQNHFLPSRIELEYNDLPQTYYVFDGDIWKDEIEDAPLNHRGWVFQERFLAPRVLHFGRHQIGWECLELEALEMFPAEILHAHPMSSKVKSTRRKIAEAHDPEPAQHPDKEFIDYWHDLVNAYSKAELTYPKDKLIAFAGIAKITMETRTDRYAAGMWQRTLLYHLPWTRYTSDREAFPITRTSSRAPSWSWVSVDGEITFPALFGGVKALFAENLEFVDPVDEAGCSFIGPSSIRVKCLRFPIGVELMDGEEEIASFDIEGFHFIASDRPSRTTIDVEVSLKELRLLVQQKKLFFMPLFASVYFFNAILLAPVPGVDTYFRLGAVQIHLKEADNLQSIGVSHAESTSSQSSNDEVGWDMNAMYFMRHCYEQSKSAHTINIS